MPMCFAKSEFKSYTKEKNEMKKILTLVQYIVLTKTYIALPVEF